MTVIIALQNKKATETFEIRTGNELKGTKLPGMITDIISESKKQLPPNEIIARLCAEHGLAYNDIDTDTYDYLIDIVNNTVKE